MIIRFWCVLIGKQGWHDAAGPKIQNYLLHYCKVSVCMSAKGRKIAIVKFNIGPKKVLGYL